MLEAGKIVRADPSANDGMVRMVDLHYKNPDTKSYVTVTRAVQKILVILPVDHDSDYDEYINQSIKDN